MNAHIKKIQEATAELQQKIINHPTYKAIKTIDDVKHFMEHHIYAVWDFMSLLKSLQSSLTCTQVPWFPVGSAKVRFLINEIVCGEESDVAFQREGNISHFELYLEAMAQIGASRESIDLLLQQLQAGVPLHTAIAQSNIPEHAQRFLNFTFEVIATNKPHIIAAVFTFGREDLIPNMFLSIVNDINEQFPDQIATFKYYLDRHIEVDGDHHSHLALEMVSELCGDDNEKWEEAKSYVLRSLESRIILWDGVLKAVTLA